MYLILPDCSMPCKVCPLLPSSHLKSWLNPYLEIILFSFVYCEHGLYTRTTNYPRGWLLWCWETIDQSQLKAIDDFLFSCSKLSYAKDTIRCRLNGTGLSMCLPICKRLCSCPFGSPVRCCELHWTNSPEPRAVNVVSIKYLQLWQLETLESCSEMFQASDS